MRRSWELSFIVHRRPVIFPGGVHSYWEETFGSFVALPLSGPWLITIPVLGDALLGALGKDGWTSAPQTSVPHGHEAEHDTKKPTARDPSC